MVRQQSVHAEPTPLSRHDEAREKPAGWVIVNTSFNVRGEPIVCTPLDAYKCFMRTEMDRLALGNYYLRKESQP